jgi:Uma2 family endonuclease
MSVTAKPIPAAAPRDPAVPDVPIYRLTVEQYHAMAEAGILTEDDPVELVEGWLVQKMTKNPPHIAATRLLHQALSSLIPKGWMVDTQNPIALTDSEPEPDLMVIRGAPLDYRDRLADPQDMALIVEVADTSLQQDRGTKKRLYAHAGIPVYWIVNLVDRRVEVFTVPSGPAEEPDYGERRDYGPDENVPVLLGGVEAGSLPVAELLP